MRTIMRKIVVGVATLVLAAVGVFAIADRGTQEIKGLVKASADKAVDGMTETFSEGVHDRKTDQELKQVRLDIIDRQVAMNLSQRKIDELAAEVATLEGSVERRQRLLGEAYPVLKTALDDGVKLVKFANEDHSLGEFQKEIDDLLAMQDRETRQLSIKRDGLARLKKSAEEGESALADMRRGLDSTEQEVAVLRSRREQAEIESQTLNLVGAATTDRDSVATSLNASVDRLRANVDQTEARNEARRGVASVTERHRSNNVTRSFNRLESLKAIHDKTTHNASHLTANATDWVTGDPADNTKPAQEESRIQTSKVMIEVKKSAP